MAHKTLINGTEYEITNGKCLVDRTEYEITSGTTIVDGTNYAISFKEPAIAQMVKVISATGSETTLNTVVCDWQNGKWIVGGSYQNDNTSQARIAYSSNFTDWTHEGKWINNATPYPSGCEVQKIFYLEESGTYIPMGLVNYYGSHYVTACLPGDINITILGSGSGYSNKGIVDMANVNGYYVFLGEIGNEARIAYTTSLSFTDCVDNINIASLIDNMSVYTIAYDNGWLIGGTRTVGGVKKACVAYSNATLPTSGFTIYDLWEGESACVYKISAGVLDDGQTSVICACGSCTAKGRIAYSTSLTGEWSFIDFNDISAVKKLQNQKDYYVALGTQSIAFSKTLTGNWKVKEIFVDATQGKLTDIFYDDGEWVITGQYYDGTNYNGVIFHTPDIHGFSTI